MKPAYRKLLWLVVILVIWNGLFCIMTIPPGAIFQIDPEGWIVRPFYAVNLTALIQWAAFYVIL